VLIDRTPTEFCGNRFPASDFKITAEFLGTQPHQPPDFKYELSQVLENILADPSDLHLALFIAIGQSQIGANDSAVMHIKKMPEAADGASECLGRVSRQQPHAQQAFDDKYVSHILRHPFHF